MEVIIKSAAELLDEFLKVRSESDEPLEIDNNIIDLLISAREECPVTPEEMKQMIKISEEAENDYRKYDH